MGRDQTEKIQWMGKGRNMVRKELYGARQDAKVERGAIRGATGRKS